MPHTISAPVTNSPVVTSGQYPTYAAPSYTYSSIGYNTGSWGVAQRNAMVEFELTHTSNNVNCKRLAQEILDQVKTTTDLIYQRTVAYGTSLYAQVFDFSQWVDSIDAILEEFAGDKLITSYDVVGDFRNNNIKAMEDGNITVDITFVQYNCINTTKLTLHIHRIQR